MKSVKDVAKVWEDTNEEEADGEGRDKNGVWGNGSYGNGGLDVKMNCSSRSFLGQEGLHPPRPNGNLKFTASETIYEMCMSFSFLSDKSTNQCW